MSLNIQPARINDLSEIHELEKKSSPHPFSLNQIQSEFKQEVATILVAREDNTDESPVWATNWTRQHNRAAGKVLSDCRPNRGPVSKIIGFVDYWVVLDEIHIINIVVHPDYRKQNIATQLFNSILINKKNAVMMCLEVRVSNIPARAFYDKMGFLEVGVRKGYYKNGEEALVMIKNIL